MKTKNSDIVKMENRTMNFIQKNKQVMYPQLVLSLIFALLPMSIFAKNNVQPIIHGKVYANGQMNLKTLPQPKQIIQGGEDECNGGNIPDQHHYSDFTVLENGQIQEVLVNESNGVIFHKQRIVGKMNQQAFKKKFKTFVYADENDPNVLSANMADEGNDSIQFIFKAGQLNKYRLRIDNC